MVTNKTPTIQAQLRALFGGIAQVVMLSIAAGVFLLLFQACESKNKSDEVSLEEETVEGTSTEKPHNAENVLEANEEEETELGEYDDWEPASPVLRRLTKSQYRNTLEDIFGAELVLPNSLEPDSKLEGLYAVGAGMTGLSSVGTEKYFAAANAVAKQVVNNPALRNLHIPCAVDDQQASKECLSETAELLGRQLWRRPVTDEEVTVLLAHAENAQEVLTNRLAGIETMIMAMLMAPEFIYIITPTFEGMDGHVQYAEYGLASRLSYFLWNSCPDEELLSAAEAGTLDSEEGLRDQVTRMLADPKTRRGVRSIFIDWWELDLLDGLVKEPSSFSHFYAKLGEDAREETLRLVEHMVIDEPEDIRNLYTTTTTFVNPSLAALYEVPAPTLEGFGKIGLDPERERAGILGHVSFLATQAHPTRPSPTLRGVFIREKLLCMSMPPPPANVDTTVPEASAEAPTMKEILEIHMQEDTCKACHALTDPIGLGLERFDGIGRYRLLENGVPIDPTGVLDGVYFEDARGIGRALAKHQLTAPCLVSTVWMYANGRSVEDGETAVLDQLEAQFENSGYRFLQLMEDTVLHPAFRQTRGGVE